MFFSYASLSQDDLIDVYYDSVEVKGGHFFIVNDSAIYVSKDTVFYLADTVDYYQTRKKTPQKADNFYNSLGTKMSGNKFSRWFYKKFFTTRKGDEKEPPKVEVSEDPYMEYEGKVINEIGFKHLEIFGTDIDDTTKHSRSSFVRFMNNVHIHTNNRIIIHQLLLNEGSILHPSELADNERVIRQLPFIKDARIFVYQPEEDSYHVNLEVVTKDVYPLKFDINPGDLTDKRFGFSHINIFGTGHEFESDFIINDFQDGSFGQEYYYRVPNVKGTFITSEVNYANTFNKEGVGISAFRDFITPDMKYAGGMSFSLFQNQEIRLANGQLATSSRQLELDSGTIVSFKQSEQDLWLGRSYRTYFNPPISWIKDRVRLLFAARINRIHFADRPSEGGTIDPRFHHRTRFLGSVGISSRRYYKDRLVKAFGRTEDIPVGNLLQFTGGYEISEFDDRIYAGLKLSQGRFLHHLGYLRGELQLGGFFRNTRFEQGVVQTRFNYFTHLYTFNLFKLRQFADLNYTIGIRPRSDEILDINDQNGLRGFNSAFVAGTQRLSLQTETVLFTPLYLASFRIAIFGFIDLGLLNSNTASPFSGQFQASMGTGIRLRNDNLAFSTIQLRWGFYPKPPIDEDQHKFSFATRPDLGLEDFNLREPQVLEFK